VKNDTKVVKNDANDVKHDTRDVKNERKDVKNDRKDVKNDANDVKNNAKDVKNDANDVKHDTKDVKHDTKVVKNDTKDVKNDAKDVKNDTKDVKNERKKKEKNDAKNAAIDMKEVPVFVGSVVPSRVDRRPKLSHHVLQTLQSHAAGSVGTSTEGMYGENRVSCLQAVCDLLTDYFLMDESSVFLDFGSGRGVPSIVAAVHSKVKASIGIEADDDLYHTAQENLIQLLWTSFTEQMKVNIRPDVCPPPWRVAYASGDGTLLSTLDPATHIYTFDLAMPTYIIWRFVTLFNESSTAIALVSFRKDLRSLFQIDAVHMATIGMDMVGSGERHCCYVYIKRKWLPQLPAKVLEILDVNIDNEHDYDAHTQERLWQSIVNQFTVNAHVTGGVSTHGARVCKNCMKLAEVPPEAVAKVEVDPLKFRLPDTRSPACVSIEIENVVKQLSKKKHVETENGRKLLWGDATETSSKRVDPGDDDDDDDGDDGDDGDDDDDDDGGDDDDGDGGDSDDDGGDSDGDDDDDGGDDDGGDDDDGDGGDDDDGGDGDDCGDGGDGLNDNDDSDVSTNDGDYAMQRSCKDSKSKRGDNSTPKLQQYKNVYEIQDNRTKSVKCRDFACVGAAKTICKATDVERDNAPVVIDDDEDSDDDGGADEGDDGDDDDVDVADDVEVHDNDVEVDDDVDDVDEGDDDGDVDEGDDDVDEGDGDVDEGDGDDKLDRRLKSDIEEKRTVFVTNLPYETAVSDLTQTFVKFGKVAFAALVKHPSSGRPSGSAFVKFASQRSAAACVAGTASSCPDTEPPTLGGRSLRVSWAVSPGEAAEVAAKRKQPTRIDDGRNMHLAEHGKIDKTSELWKVLSDGDKRRRDDAWKEKCYRMQETANFFVNPLRLSIRNLPRHVSKNKLRDTVVDFITADASSRETLTTEYKAKEVSGRFHITHRRPNYRNMAHALIPKVSVLVNKTSSPSSNAKSRGIAFIEVRSHVVALRVLELLNGSVCFGNDRRPIVEFALEDRRALEIQRRRKTDKNDKNELSKNELSKNELSKNEISKNELSKNELSKNELSKNDNVSKSSSVSEAVVAKERRTRAPKKASRGRRQREKKRQNKEKTISDTTNKNTSMKKPSKTEKLIKIKGTSVIMKGNVPNKNVKLVNKNVKLVNKNVKLKDDLSHDDLSRGRKRSGDKFSSERTKRRRQVGDDNETLELREMIRRHAEAAAKVYRR